MRDSLFIAGLETRHFDFEGTGPSPAVAIDVLKQGLREHGTQCGLELDWWNVDGWSDEELFTVREIKSGAAYRDRSELPPGAPAPLPTPATTGEPEGEGMAGGPFYVLAGPSPGVPRKVAGPFPEWRAADHDATHREETDGGWAIVVEQALTP